MWAGTHHGISKINHVIPVDTGSVSFMEKLPAPSCTMYPNPATTFVNVKVKGHLTQAVLSIITLSGQCLEKHALAEGSNPISLEHLPLGYYLFKVRSTESAFTEKLVKW